MFTFCSLVAVVALAGCGSIPAARNLDVTLGAVRDDGLALASQRHDNDVRRRYTATSGQRQTIRVMSSNIRVKTMFDVQNNWPHRRKAMFQTIREYDPDVLGTQESLLDQTNELKQALPQYEYVGVGRNDGHTGGEMCGVFFRRDRFTLLGQGHFWLSTEPEKPGSRSWGAWFPRLVTWVRLSDRRAYGREFFVFNTHFSHADKDARLNSAKLLRTRMRTIAGDDPVIVTGDFNARESSPVYDVMTNGQLASDIELADTYRDMHATRGPNEKTHHKHRGGVEGERIDWILVSPDFDTIAATIDRNSVDGQYPSDHYPVNAEIRWNTTRAVADAQR